MNANLSPARDPLPHTAPAPPAPANASPPDAKPAPRLRRADRQTLVPAMPLDDLLTPQHPARAIWAFVQGLDLSPLLAPIRAVEGHPGRPPIDPQIPVALWLLATVEGIGSARALDSLGTHHHAFRWICGNVAVNYHSLSDFRVGQLEFVDDLLTHSVAALLEQDLVDRNRVAQDGMRVRARAGAASFRRRPTLEQCLQEAHTQVQRLRAELETDPGEANRQQQRARARAARARAERIRQALERMPEMEAKKQANEKAKARVSTTDPEGTVMKMADGGFRPAYKVEFSAATDSQVIVAVAVTTSGSDMGQMAPLVEQVHERFGVYPKDVLNDGGFAKQEDIDAVSAPDKGCVVYAPVPEPKDPNQDRYAPPPGDSPAVVSWRARRATAAAQEIYKERAATAACVNAQARNRGLVRLLGRGVQKVKAIALWFAVAHNVMRGLSLRAAAAVAR
jgi:transposase